MLNAELQEMLCHFPPHPRRGTGHLSPRAHPERFPDTDTLTR